jgi:hypothetical protein
LLQVIKPGNVAKAAASIAGIAKVLVADDKSLENGLAENLAPLMQSLSGRLFAYDGLRQQQPAKMLCRALLLCLM